MIAFIGRFSRKLVIINSHSLPTSSTAADSPAFDAPLALGTYSFAGVI